MNLKFNLQLFSQEKTEKATPKKRQEARKKGQVLKSPEVSSALVLITAFLVLRFWVPFIVTRMLGLIEYMLVNYFNQEITIQQTGRLTLLLFEEFLILFGPIGLSVLVIGIIANYMQVGPLFTGEPIKIKLSKINPIEGFKRLFSKRSLVQLVKSLMKVTLISYMVFINIKNYINNIPNIMDMDLLSKIITIGSTVFKLAMYSGGVMVVIAIFDYFYSWWEFENNLKMSKHEVKEEYKQMEGDPQIKGKIKERQRLMANRRMMQEIPNADVVITNPTHFAVALKYDLNSGQAPIVVAKGQDLIAQQIKEIAKEHGVILYEDVALARSLYKSVEIGETIPFEFFKAVAEVLAYVYKVKGKVVNL